MFVPYCNIWCSGRHEWTNPNNVPYVVNNNGWLPNVAGILRIKQDIQRCTTYRANGHRVHTKALEMRARHASNSYKCITRLIVTRTRHYYAAWVWSCTTFMHSVRITRNTPPYDKLMWPWDNLYHHTVVVVWKAATYIEMDVCCLSNNKNGYRCKQKICDQIMHCCFPQIWGSYPVPRPFVSSLLHNSHSDCNSCETRWALLHYTGRHGPGLFITGALQ